MSDQMMSAREASDVDRTAIEELAREFRPSLLKYFSRRVRNPNDIEDLVQEVFVRLVRREQHLDMQRVRGYVFQTASSVLIDWVRRPAVRYADAHQRFDPDQHGGLTPAPERVLQGRQQLARAVEIVMAMPDRTRQVFMLARFEEMTYADIARRLGISVSAVEKHMRKAMLKLIEQADL